MTAFWKVGEYDVEIEFFLDMHGEPQMDMLHATDMWCEDFAVSVTANTAVQEGIWEQLLEEYADEILEIKKKLVMGEV